MVGLVFTMFAHIAEKTLPIGTPMSINSDFLTSERPSTRTTLGEVLHLSAGQRYSVDKELVTNLAFGSVDRFVAGGQVHAIPTAGWLATDQ